MCPVPRLLPHMLLKPFHRLQTSCDTSSKVLSTPCVIGSKVLSTSCDSSKDLSTSCVTGSKVLSTLCVTSCKVLQHAWMPYDVLREFNYHVEQVSQDEYSLVSLFPSLRPLTEELVQLFLKPSQGPSSSSSITNSDREGSENKAHSEREGSENKANSDREGSENKGICQGGFRKQIVSLRSRYRWQDVTIRP